MSRVKVSGCDWYGLKQNHAEDHHICRTETVETFVSAYQAIPYLQEFGDMKNEKQSNGPEAAAQNWHKIKLM